MRRQMRRRFEDLPERSRHLGERRRDLPVNLPAGLRLQNAGEAEGLRVEGGEAAPSHDPARGPRREPLSFLPC